MRAVAFFVSSAFAVTAFLTATSVSSIFCALGNKALVTGSTKFYTPNGYFDLATLQPSVGNPNVLAAYEKRAAPDVV